MGALMYQSHASYTACGLGSRGTDAIVELVRAEGPANGLYGARITGGGSGGTVAVLGRSDADATIARIRERFRTITGYAPLVFSGSSEGAARAGPLSLGF
jgi:L-arabinokinase